MVDDSRPLADTEKIDIVTRLRANHDWNGVGETCMEAADEIERLRAEIDLKGYRLDDALDEINRLNTAMTAMLHNSLKNLSIGSQKKVSIADDIAVNINITGKDSSPVDAESVADTVTSRLRRSIDPNNRVRIDSWRDIAASAAEAIEVLQTEIRMFRKELKRERALFLFEYDEVAVLRKALDIAADEMLLHDEYRSMTQEQIALLLIEKAQSR